MTGNTSFRKRNLAVLVAASVAGSMLGGCAGGNDGDQDNGTTTKSLSFTAVAAPSADADKRVVQASPTATVNGAANTIGYHAFLRTGDRPGTSPLGFGTLVDQTGAAIINPGDGSVRVSASPDFASLLKVGTKLFNVTHFETGPGVFYLTELSQDATGTLTAVQTSPVDMSAWGGVYTPCAGSVTPWNTHLGSEEYEPDARAFEADTHATATDLASVHFDASFLAQGQYFGLNTATATVQNVIDSGLNPYRYGFPVEVAVAEDGSTTVNKRLAMGRVALELAYVMPDRKTAYMSDDGTNVGLYMFVADTAGDLSAGTLYAAKWTQTSADGSNGGAATISWISLGHATQAEVQTAITGGTVFSDIFATETPNADGSCPTAGFTSVNIGHEDGKNECLQLKAGMEITASRLETRRYAGYLGATTEFSKEEGITFDPAGKKLYVAMSDIRYGMENNAKSGVANTKYDKGADNDIRLAWNSCGAVYRGDVGADAAVGSDYVLKNMSALVVGVPDTNAGTPYAGSNTCRIDGIANPDNLTFVTGYRTLIIGEDTGSGHQNDAIWSYNLDSGTLTRIETTPYGAETTSPYWYPNIGGHGYLMSVVQHPYGESDQGQLTDPNDARGYVGYVGPFPAMD
jgi:uncharacterized protein